MKTAVLALLTIGMFCLANPCLGADDYPLRDAVECSPRSGLPNFFAKIQKGDDITIAYLGGSITAQPGYRVLSQKWFEAQNPNVKFKGIHAAIGGTGSNLGVFRLERDVLRHIPDLLFVEFAVNDSRASPSQITKAMEGIVRQTWTKLPDCDIVFVYTIVAGNVKNLQAGKMKRSASVMEAVADHYAIPSIHLGIEAAKLEKEGKLVMKDPNAKVTAVSGDDVNFDSEKLPMTKDGVIVFAKDGVHPYTSTGHHLYMRAIERSIPAIKASGSVGNHQLTAPLDPANWESAKMIALTKDMIRGTATELPNNTGLGKSFGSRMPSVWKLEPGATLSFKFKGSTLYLYDLLGPGCGMVEVDVDGKTRKIKRMDRYCSYTRLSMLGLGQDFKPDQVHTVKITVLDEKFDKREILFESKHADFDKNPAKYEPLDWYTGAIMLVGELVD
ncbi:MAG TPA: acyl-CoA thioesterase [Phycisphaerales bacterium]|nr:acyl-CoA thioesterase [Phycisphaerales bacterium]|tara:strand:+ start:1985 stop:3313 length:1329 start_codon:yes stop_codon:yes gene_type:complete